MSSKFLQPGDKIRVIAPSWRGLSSNLPRITQYIESLGYVPVITEGIYNTDEPLYSNTDDFRARDLIDSLVDDSKMIWALTGGSGSYRLLPYLEKSLPVNLPQKIFVGFSDSTFIHSYLNLRYNWQTIHGLMLEEIVEQNVSPESIAELLSLLRDPGHSVHLTGMKQLDNGVEMSGGTLQAKISGGNLTMTQISCGTPWQVQSQGKIIFWEDYNEAPYRYERMFDQFKQTGVLDEIRGIIFGDVVPTENPDLLEILIDRFAKSVKVPVFMINGIGHDFVNYPLPLNTDATIQMYDAGQRLCSLDVKNLTF